MKDDNLFQALKLPQLFARAGWLYYKNFGLFLNLTLALLVTEYVLGSMFYNPNTLEEFNERLMKIVLDDKKLRVFANSPQESEIVGWLLDTPGAVGSLWYTLLVPPVLSLVAVSATTLMTASIYCNRPTLKYKRLFAKLVPTAVIQLYRFFLTASGMALFLDAIILYHVAVLLIEDKAFWGSLRRSYSLFSLVALQNIGVVFVISLLDDVINASLADFDYSLGTSISLIAVPFMQLLNIVMYLNIRIEHEGLDLVTLCREMDVEDMCEDVPDLTNGHLEDY